MVGLHIFLVFGKPPRTHIISLWFLFQIVILYIQSTKHNGSESKKQIKSQEST